MQLAQIFLFRVAKRDDQQSFPLYCDGNCCGNKQGEPARTTYQVRRLNAEHKTKDGPGYYRLLLLELLELELLELGHRLCTP
jgi:hypothetical protein